MGDISIDLTTPEALFAHAAMVNAAAAANDRLAKMDGAPEHERDAVLAEVRYLNRVCARISSALYPRCDYIWDDPECDRSPVAGRTTCQFHLDRLAGKVPVFQA